MLFGGTGANEKQTESKLQQMNQETKIKTPTYLLLMERNLQWLQTLMSGLRSPSFIPNRSQLVRFTGRLRLYESKGFWHREQLLGDAVGRKKRHRFVKVVSVKKIHVGRQQYDYTTHAVKCSCELVCGDFRNLPNSKMQYWT